MNVRVGPVIWITPYVPKDEAHRAAVGEVALRHTHLDHMLRMTVKSLTGATVNEALLDTHRNGSAKLRRRIRQEAKDILSQADYERLDQLLVRCEAITKRRNRVIHNVWAVHLSEPNVGEMTALNDDHVWEPVPSVATLSELCRDLEAMVEEVNESRLNGWLSDAISRLGEK